MKKAYVRPEIGIEYFQLDASIAGCDERLPFTIEDTCTTAGYFAEYCDFDLISAGGENDGYCYHGPAIKLINS